MAIKPIFTGQQLSLEPIPLESESSTVVVDNESFVQIKANICPFDVFSTALPALADMLVVHYNKCIQDQGLADPEEFLVELKECIDALKLAKEHSDFGDESEETSQKISEALLWLACNWGSLWL